MGIWAWRWARCQERALRRNWVGAAELYMYRPKIVAGLRGTRWLDYNPRPLRAAVGSSSVESP